MERAAPLSCLPPDCVGNVKAQCDAGDKYKNIFVGALKETADGSAPPVTPADGRLFGKVDTYSSAGHVSVSSGGTRSVKKKRWSYLCKKMRKQMFCTRRNSWSK